MRRTLALATTALLAAPGVALAGPPPGPATPAITNEALYITQQTNPSVGCFDPDANGIQCIVYSGASLNFQGYAYADGTASAFPEGYTLKLFGGSTELGSAAQNGLTSRFTFVTKARTTTRFNVVAFQDGVTDPVAVGRNNDIFVKARIIDSTRAHQTGSAYTFKGKVAFVPGFGGGRFELQRCKVRKASRCRLAKDGDWKPAAFKKPLQATGSYKTTVQLSGTGKFWFRLRFVPKTAQNVTERMGIVVTRTIS